ncbi:hypothetical protein [Pedobacter sp. JCM 36344]|uniref:hypothetical protein n=1 Tax=Pedobacter sp. JCM 36344 TaxID=3374280 RepID=UPI00397CE89D
MKNDIKISITDDYLKSLAGATPAETKGFFYERLLVRMKAAETKEEWLFQSSPALIVGALSIMLVLNMALFFRYPEKDKSDIQVTLKDFAAAYDQTLYSNY